MSRWQIKPDRALLGGEMGGVIEYHYDMVTESDLDEIYNVLVDDARQHVPSGHKFVIRQKNEPKDGTKVDFGRTTLTRAEMAENYGAAWWYTQDEDINMQGMDLCERKLHDHGDPTGLVSVLIND